MSTPHLHFTKDKPFTIMQIADAQESKDVAVDTLRLINAALDKVKPDLVVFTGDQIKGYSPSFGRHEQQENMKAAIATILKPLIERNILFAPTFGNHDEVSSFTREEQIEYYRTFENCVVPEISNEPGTYFLPIYKDEKSDSVAMGVYLFDTQGSNSKGWDAVIHPSVLTWYREVRDGLKNKQGDYVPSIAFQHIPVWEYYDTLTKVDKRTPNAVRVYEKNHLGYYINNMEKTKQLDFFNESPAVSGENSGEFSAFKEQGDVFALYVGHDHRNCFVGTHEGIDLGYTPGAGFNVYGPGIRRGVREFTFTQENPRDYKTQVHQFKDLIGDKVEKPVLDFILQHTPSSVEQGVHDGVSIAAAVLAVGAAAFMVYKIIKRKRR